MKWDVKSQFPEYEYEGTIEAEDESALFDLLYDETADYAWELINALADECPGDYSNCSSLDEIENHMLSYITDTVNSQYGDKYFVCTSVEPDSATYKVPMADLAMESLSALWDDSSTCYPKVGRFVESILTDYESNSRWHIALKSNSGEIIESVSKWPKPTYDNTTEDIWGNQHTPIVWFGPDGIYPSHKWILWDSSTKDIDSVWFDSDTWTIVEYLISDSNDIFLIWYTGECGYYAPDMNSIRQTCPIALSKDDSYDVVKKKVFSYLHKLYNQFNH